MSTHGHTTIGNPTSRPALAMDRGRGFVLAVTLLAGLFMTAAGVAALLAPGWFADAAGFPRHPTSCMTPAPSSSASGSPCCPP